MKITILLSLLLLIACGRNAPEAEADKYILNHEKPESLSALIDFKSEPRDFILFAFPHKSELVNYSFDSSKSKIPKDQINLLFSVSKLNEEKIKDIIKDIPEDMKEDIAKEMKIFFPQVNMEKNIDNYIPYLIQDISPSMTTEEKFNRLTAKVLAISEARDNSKRLVYTLTKREHNIAKEIEKKVNKDLPCFEVQKKTEVVDGVEVAVAVPNQGKCSLNKINGVTKEKQNKPWKISTCDSFNTIKNKYLNIQPDTNIPADSIPKFPKELEKNINFCDLKDKFVGLQGDGKTLAADLIGSADEKLLFKGASEVESSIRSTFEEGGQEFGQNIIFNYDKKEFEEFSVIIDFKDPKTAFYSLKNKKIENLVVTEGNDGRLWVDFTIITPNFLLKTQGLSLSFDEVFGLRISGKTVIEYTDGRRPPRYGLMRIDLSPKEKEE